MQILKSEFPFGLTTPSSLQLQIDIQTLIPCTPRSILQCRSSKCPIPWLHSTFFSHWCPWNQTAKTSAALMTNSFSALLLSPSLSAFQGKIHAAFIFYSVIWVLHLSPWTPFLLAAIFECVWMSWILSEQGWSSLARKCRPWSFTEQFQCCFYDYYSVPSRA